jgi:hypothetical protein
MACTCGPQVASLTEELKTCDAIVQVFGKIICADARLASSLASTLLCYLLVPKRAHTYSRPTEFADDESLPLNVRSVLQSLITAAPDTALSNAVQIADEAMEQGPVSL